MILDCDMYRLNIPRIALLTKDLTHKERLKAISGLSAATNVPVIIICCYLGELYGFDQDIEDYITDLRKFYHNIDGIINVKRP